MKKGNNILLCVLLIFSLCSFSCTNQKQVTTKSLKEKIEEDVYKIAVAAPQFGPYEALGLSIIHGAELAVENKNKAGGINGKEIKLIKVDDGGLPGDATWRANTLVNEMVLGVIGHLNSDISIPASEIYSKAKIAEISPGSTSPFFTERESTRGYVFRTINRDDAQGKLSANYVIKNGYKKVAVIYNNRPYGLSLASEFLKELNPDKNMIELTLYKAYSVGTDDFSKEIKSLSETKPDFLFFIGEYSDASKFLRQSSFQSLKIVFLGSDGVFDPELINIARKNAEGALVISSKYTNESDFAKMYTEKFNKELGGYSAPSYDATNILINAIEKVKDKDSRKIAEEIQKTQNYKGIIGNISFNSKGDLKDPMFAIYKVDGGMFIPYNTFSNP